MTEPISVNPDELILIGKNCVVLVSDLGRQTPPQITVAPGRATVAALVGLYGGVQTTSGVMMAQWITDGQHLAGAAGAYQAQDKGGVDQFKDVLKMITDSAKDAVGTLTNVGQTGVAMGGQVLQSGTSVGGQLAQTLGQVIGHLPQEQHHDSDAK